MLTRRFSISAVAGTVVAASLAVVPAPVTGQPTFGIDTELRSHYVFRGVTRRNAWVWQTGLYGAWRLSRFTATGGGWMNFDFTRAALGNPDAIGYGTRIGERNYWLEGAVDTDVFEAGTGFVRFIFDDEDQSALLGNDVASRNEWYGRVVLHPGNFSLGAYAWKAFDHNSRPGWTYGEARVSWHVPVLPAGLTLLRFGGIVGWHDGSLEHASGSGVTHWELYSEAQLSVGLLGLLLYALPSIHVQLNVDDATRRVQRGAVDTGPDVKAWFGFSISYQHQ